MSTRQTVFSELRAIRKQLDKIVSNIPCSTCGGAGRIGIGGVGACTGTDGIHHPGYTTHWADCKHCKGSGKEYKGRE